MTFYIRECGDVGWIGSCNGFVGIFNIVLDTKNKALRTASNKKQKKNKKKMQIKLL